MPANYTPHILYVHICVVCYTPRNLRNIQETKDQQKSHSTKSNMKEQNANAFGGVGCVRYVIEKE